MQNILAKALAFSILLFGIALAPDLALAKKKSCTLKLTLKNATKKKIIFRKIESKTMGSMVWRKVYGKELGSSTQTSLAPGASRTFTFTIKMKKSWGCSRARSFRVFACREGAKRLRWNTLVGMTKPTPTHWFDKFAPAY